MNSKLTNIVRTNKNDKTPFLCLDGRQKTVEPFVKFETSTPNNLFLGSISESLSFHPESLIKKPVLKSEPTPVLKLEPKLPTPKNPDAFLSSEDEIMKMVQTTHPKDWTTEIIFDSESNSPEPLISEPASISEPTLVWKLQPKLPTPNPDVFMSNEKRIISASQKFETSTPENLFLENISESQSNLLKLQPKLPTPIYEAFMSNEKPIISQSNKFEIYNSKNCVSEYILESQSFRPESLIKESVLKLEPKPVWKFEPKLSEKPIISLGSKIRRMKSTKEFPESKRIHILQDVDLASTDLRFRLMAKRKFKGVTDTAAKRPFIQNNRVPVRVQDALHTSRDVIAPSVAQHFATTPRNSVEPFTWTGIVPDLPTCIPYKNNPKC